MKEIETLKNVKDCVGKTITGCVFGFLDRSLLLSFTDGTILVIDAKNDWDGDPEICRDGMALRLGDFDDELLLEACIVDQEYIDEQERKRAAAEAERKNQIECQERMEYMRLKKKFDAPPEATDQDKKLADLIRAHARTPELAEQLISCLPSHRQDKVRQELN